MTSVFIIAECGSSWRFGTDHLTNAYRMIQAAKSCGADAVKFQWTSDYKLMMARRGASPAEELAYTFVQYDASWLPLLKAHADKVGIEFMCTAFLPQDVAVIAPLVKRFKVAAKEAGDKALFEEIKRHAHSTTPTNAVRKGWEDHFKPVIVSDNTRSPIMDHWWDYGAEILWCVSKYPTAIDEVSLENVTHGLGLSDHTAHVLTGAVAVGAGARVIEAHCKLWDTPEDNPDWPHSHVCDRELINMYHPEQLINYPHKSPFAHYVQNIRMAERMMGA